MDSDTTRPEDEDITRLLARVNAGDADAWERLVPVVYDELRVLARALMSSERAGHTLQPTALVHEAFVRLGGQRASSYEGRRHFFAAAAGAMRRLLVDHARRRDADKRGGEWQRVTLSGTSEPGAAPGPAFDVDALELHEALEELAALSPRQAQLVELRYFGGMSMEEIAEHLGLSMRQVKGHWTAARGWLYQRLRPG